MMNILYMSSGYKRIYQFFDQCILNELQKFPDVSVEYFANPHDCSSLKSVCDEFKPDMVLTMLGDNLSQNTLNWIKRQAFRSILWLTEDPYYIDRAIKVMPYFDITFSIDYAAVDYYKTLQFTNVHHLPLGTDPHVFSPAGTGNKNIDVCLIGYPYPDRIRIASSILKNTPYRIHVVGNMWRTQFFRRGTTANLSLLNRWVPPMEAAHYYRHAKIVLNTFRPFNEKTNLNRAGVVNRSVNNRTFDIAGCGAFQLIQSIDDLSQYFEEKKEIVSFQTDDDLIDKLAYYLKNDTERLTIGANARKKVLLQHTFHHRLSQILETI
jgi:spore maturation protein CgeB